MADLTEAQKAEVYFFCGQAQRFVQVNTAIEQGIAKINSFPDQQKLLTNGLTASPAGLLAAGTTTAAGRRHSGSPTTATSPPSSSSSRAATRSAS